MGLVWFVVSMALGAVLLPLGILFGVIKCFYQSHFSRGLRYADTMFFTLAKAFDKYGNVVCEALFNATLIKKTSQHPFGKIEQTISMVIGYNLKEGTLTMAGWVLNQVLNLFDKNHSIKAIEQSNSTIKP